MKYRFFCFYFLLFFGILSSCHSKKTEINIIPDAQKNHLQRNHLFGKIKTIRTESFIINEQDSTENRSNTYIQNYSSDGYLLTYIILNKDNDTLSTKNIHYKNGKENDWIEKDYSDNNIRRCEYKYDINHNLLGEYYYAEDSLVYHIEYKTDGIGGITEMKRIYPNHFIINKMIYNELGLITRINEYDPQGTLYKYFTIEYDNYGDEVNKRTFKSGEELIEYTYTQYNKYGHLIKTIYEDHIHTTQEIREYSEHDAEGNWMKEICSKNNRKIYYRNRTINYY